MMERIKMAGNFKIIVRMKNGGKVKKMLNLKMAGNFKNDRKIKNGGKF